MATTQIDQAIRLLECEIGELKALLGEWNRLSVNLNGSKQYKGVARRIVLQSEKVEELIRPVFSRVKGKRGPEGKDPNTR
jgi:hypothetical protein